MTTARRPSLIVVCVLQPRWDDDSQKAFSHRSVCYSRDGMTTARRPSLIVVCVTAELG